MLNILYNLVLRIGSWLLTGHWVLWWQDEALCRLPYHRCSADDGACWSTSIWPAWESRDLSSRSQEEFLQEGTTSVCTTMSHAFLNDFLSQGVGAKCCHVVIAILTLWFLHSFCMNRFQLKACLRNIFMTTLMLRWWLVQYQASRMLLIIWRGHTFSVAW